MRAVYWREIPQGELQRGKDSGQVREAGSGGVGEKGWGGQARGGGGVSWEQDSERLYLGGNHFGVAA